MKLSVFRLLVYKKRWFYVFLPKTHQPTKYVKARTIEHPLQTIPNVYT